VSRIGGTPVSNELVQAAALGEVTPTLLAAAAHRTAGQDSNLGLTECGCRMSPGGSDHAEGDASWQRRPTSGDERSPIGQL
jgi:hypothetical protein